MMKNIKQYFLLSYDSTFHNISNYYLLASLILPHSGMSQPQSG